MCSMLSQFISIVIRLVQRMFANWNVKMFEMIQKFNSHFVNMDRWIQRKFHVRSSVEKEKHSHCFFFFVFSCRRSSSSLGSIRWGDRQKWDQNTTKINDELFEGFSHLFRHLRWFSTWTNVLVYRCRRSMGSFSFQSLELEKKRFQRIFEKQEKTIRFRIEGVWRTQIKFSIDQFDHFLKKFNDVFRYY